MSLARTAHFRGILSSWMISGAYFFFSGFQIYMIHVDDSTRKFYTKSVDKKNVLLSNCLWDLGAPRRENIGSIAWNSWFLWLKILSHIFKNFERRSGYPDDIFTVPKSVESEKIVIFGKPIFSHQKVTFFIYTKSVEKNLQISCRIFSTPKKKSASSHTFRGTCTGH